MSMEDLDEYSFERILKDVPIEMREWGKLHGFRSAIHLLELMRITRCDHCNVSIELMYCDYCANELKLINAEIQRLKDEIIKESV